MSKAKDQIETVKARLGVFFEKVGGLTKVQRLLICLVTFVLIGGVYYYFIFRPKHDQFKKAQAEHEKQVKILNQYKKSAAQIAKYEIMMAQAQEKYNVAMKALPDKRELPSLLTGISNCGTRAGLTFNLFKPENEIDKEFYKEIPVSIKVEGRYHQLTDFFYQLVNLNRIVNVTDVKVVQKKGGETLEMACTAVTYMFIEKKEATDKKKKRKRK